MALQTTTQIFISGTEIQSYVNLKLIQEIDKHHDLELVCRTDVVEKLSEELIGERKNYLGGVITIHISATTSFDGYKELEFKGVITKVKAIKGFDLSTGDLVTLCAKSTSILADDGSHYASFNDISLVDILNRTFQGYDKGMLETSFSPVFSDTIHYSVQHNQSAFNYASRLAAYHNEWFYYDGKKLVFGSPGTEETVLTYGMDLQDFSLELSSVPNSFDYFTNDYLTDELHKKSSSEVIIPSEGYHGFTDKKSKELFTKQTQVYHNLYSDESIKSRLNTQVEQYTKALAMQQVIAKGSSDNPGVNLGEIIKVKGYGSYRITKVTHINREGGIYINNFEAVDANFTAYPKMNIHLYPKSDTQIATVVENVDPEGLSRIRVQFPWQKPHGEITPWLRVVSPHAGGKKGFHFIPEKDEEVLVGFEGGNAERPFVMGSLYTGSAQPGGFQSDNNDIKAIQSRSGNRVIMNDKDGSITMADPSGNAVVMQGNGEVIIKAPNKLTLISTDINILAGNSINIAAKPDESGGEGIINILAEKSMETTVVNKGYSVIAKEDITVNSETKKIDIAGKELVKISSEKIETISENNTNIGASEMVITTSGVTEINGKEVNVNES